MSVSTRAKDVEGSTLHEERFHRVQSFRAVMTDKSVDVAVVQSMEDMYWLTGFNTPGAPRCQALVVTQYDLLISSRTLEVTNALLHSTLSASAGHAEGEDPVAHLARNILQFNPATVGLQSETERTTPADSQALLALLTAKKGKSECSIVDISGCIRSMRSTKSRRELSLMRRAGELCAASVHAALKQTAENVHCTESDVAAHALLGARRGGGDFAAYPPFICAGVTAPLGHYAASQVQVPIRNGENVFYELAGCYQRYHVAVMRTAHVGTELPPALQKAESCVQAALQSMRAALVPGVLPKTVYDAGECQLQSLLADGWIISQRSGYSIGIGFPTDWGECEEIMIRSIVTGNEKPIPASATLHLIPWVTRNVYGAVGISDTVCVTPSGGESLLPADKPEEKIVLIAPRRPHRADALSVQHTFGKLLATPTPVVSIAPLTLSQDADFTLHVKDESSRLGQTAFKALGGGYACAKVLMQRKGLKPGDVAADMENLARKDGEEVITFTSATERMAIMYANIVDGADADTGAGLAWAAQTLGHRAVVFLPQGAAASRVVRIRSLGAEAIVTELGYDATVTLSAQKAQENGWVLIQDTAWEGYTEVPADIMAAYKFIAHEALEAVKDKAITHLVLQVGVGSFAAAIVQYVREALGRRVVILCVEPQGSNSLQRGVKTDLPGSPHTWSVGLDCCVVSDLAWPTLRDEVNASAGITDSIAAHGVRVLHNNANFASGESGAASTVGCLLAISRDARYHEALGLTSDSHVLVFNTEGVTDPVTTEQILEESGEDVVLHRDVTMHFTDGAW